MTIRFLALASIFALSLGCNQAPATGQQGAATTNQTAPAGTAPSTGSGGSAAGGAGSPSAATSAANPVGELVLRIAEACTPERLELSDATCTGLQLVEFWQDLGEDAAKGRVYIPLEDLERFEYNVDDVLASRPDDRLRRLMSFEAHRTRDLLERGRVLAKTLPGRLGFAVRLFTAGGLAALDDLERRGFDTFSHSAHASRARRLVTGARELVRRAAP